MTGGYVPPANPVPRVYACSFAPWSNSSVETTHLSHGLYSTGLQGVQNIHPVPTVPALRQLSAPFYERACFGGIVTDNFFRPFALLRFITLRPPGVAIRARKPWVLLRLILLG